MVKTIIISPPTATLKIKNNQYINTIIICCNSDVAYDVLPAKKMLKGNKKSVETYNNKPPHSHFKNTQKYFDYEHKLVLELLLPL